mmetsp:Transcript_5869/g.14917  ORF Transcript_5869/g.14917 Transcript_5869/m.14917 type:complete len:439 (+) Transcript_5869:291-1607(+)
MAEPFPSHYGHGDAAAFDRMVADMLGQPALDDGGAPPVDLGGFTFDDSGYSIDPATIDMGLSIPTDMEMSDPTGAIAPPRSFSAPHSSMYTTHGAAPPGGLADLGAVEDILSMPIQTDATATAAPLQTPSVWPSAPIAPAPPSLTMPVETTHHPGAAPSPGLLHPMSLSPGWQTGRPTYAAAWGSFAGKRSGLKKESQLSRFGSYHGTGIDDRDGAYGPMVDLAELSTGAHRRGRARSMEAKDKEKRRRPVSRSRKEKSGNCVCCEATNTPLWREGKNGCRLCNACGIRWVKYGIACDNCKYVPRKSEASKEACPRCNNPFPPPDKDAIRRRTASANGGGSSSGSAPFATAASPAAVPTFAAPFPDAAFGRRPRTPPAPSGGGHKGFTLGAEAATQMMAMPSHMAHPLPAGVDREDLSQHISPFTFGTGGPLSRSITR